MAAYTVFFKLEVYLVILVLLLIRAKDAAKTEPISNKRLCADKACNVVISRGRALASHLSSDLHILSFRKDDIINIKSKSAGSNPRLWGGECNGQRGYFDRNFVREIQVYVAHPQFLENTEPQQFKDIGRHPPAPVDKANRRDHFDNKAKIAEDDSEDKPKFIRSDATRPKLEDEDEVTGESILSELEPDTKDEVGSDSSNKSVQEEPENVKTESDLKEAPPENEADHHDNDWDDLDIDYVDTDRGRFDTSAFNQFVKKSLGVESEKSQEDPKEAKNVDATFHVSPQEALVNESPKEDAASVELTKEKPSVEPPNEKSSVEGKEKPTVDLPTENSRVEPTKEKLSVEPIQDKLSVEPTKEKLSVEPIQDKLSVEPTKEKHSVEPIQDKLSVEPTKEKLSVEPIQDKLSVEPTKEKLSVQQAQEKLSVEPTQEKLLVEPTKEKLTVEPAQEKLSVEPTKEKLSVEPTQEKLLVEPTKEKLTVEPAQEKLSVEPTKEKLSVEPAQEKLSVEPTKEKFSVEPAQEKLSVEPTKEKLTVEPAQEKLSVEPTKEKLSVNLPEIPVGSPVDKVTAEASNEKSDVESLKDTATVELPKISVEAAKSQSVGEAVQDDKSVVEKSPEKYAASQEPSGNNLGDKLERNAVEEKEKGQAEEVEVQQEVEVQHDEPNIVHLTQTESREKKPESVKPSDDDGIKTFPMEDEEEESDYGAEIPVFDPLSVVSRDIDQKAKKPASIEPQAVEIPTADYADASKGASEVKVEELKSKASLSGSETKDITAGQGEAMKVNIGIGDIIDAGSNANSDKVAAGNANSDKVVAGNANSDKVVAGDANSDKVVAGSKTGAESGAIKQGIDNVIAKESSVDGAVNEKDRANQKLDNLPDASVNGISSEVRPDTPSGETPEHGQSDDPVSAQTVKQKNDLNIETGRKDASGDNDEKLSPVDLNLFQRDEGKVVSGGFEGFLQPSSMATHLSDDASSTPSLDSAARIVESVTSLVSASDIHHTKATEDKQETSEGQEIKPDHPAADKYETVIEAGSTLILDAEGNIVSSAFMPDLAAQTKSAVVLEHSSTVDKPLVTPTAVVESTVSSAEVKQPPQGHIDVSLQSSIYNEVSNNSEHVHIDKHLLDSDTSDVYKSSDFSSRKVLSVNNQPPEKHHDPHDHSHDHASHDHHHDTPDHRHDPHDHHHNAHDHHHDAHDHDHHHDDHHHTEHPHEELPEGASPSLLSPALVKTQSEELSSVILATLGEKPAAQDDKPTKDENGHVSDNQPAIKEMNKEYASENKGETSTQSPEDYEIPPPPTPGDDQVPSDFDSGDTYHSRKINDGELPEDEETKSSGFVLMADSFIDTSAKFVFEKLPPWMIRPLLLLEPLGLSPGMSLLVALFSIMVPMTACLASVCSSGKKKPKLRATLDVIGELEAKLQLAIKEKENLEDSVKDIKIENQTLKEEMSKQKKSSGKNEIEIHAVQHQNETLKKHVLELDAELQELKKNSVTKQGEAKQTNKKAKELEKLIKKLEEKEKSVEQENQKLTLELRHKEEQLVSIEAKVSGLTEQIGHLQISKDQLLTEAEDWKEKVTDLKERLEQRDEEFRQMQENIMFKDNELEVLKDCFLQLKSFEEEEAEVEDGDAASERVQEKLSAMMDVSKVNASLRAIDEERNMLSNRLHIESEARKELEEQLENSRRSVESSMADKMKAERQCQEAQTKLNVLSSYFKEKEMQLQRELGEHEALKKQNLNKLVSADETTRTMQQEVEIFRTQVESLKRELASSERDFRSQIAANEKKAHENWLAARAAERELKEARHDAGVLRQKLTDLERRQFMGPGGLIRPLPTRGLPPPGMLNGPPPPAGMDRSPSRGSLPPLPPPHLRDEEFLRRGPPMGIRQPHPDARSPPLPPFGDARSPPPRMPPPGMLDGRSPPPYDRRPPPPHMLDRRSPPFRLPPPEMLPHPMRGGPLPPPHFAHGGSPSSGADSPHLDRADGRYPPPYARNPPFPQDRPSPRGPAPPRQQQSQV